MLELAQQSLLLAQLVLVLEPTNLLPTDLRLQLSTVVSMPAKHPIWRWEIARPTQKIYESVGSLAYCNCRFTHANVKLGGFRVYNVVFSHTQLAQIVS